MKKNNKKKFEYTKEVLISAVAFAVVSFTLTSLETPVKETDQKLLSKKDSLLEDSYLEARAPASPSKLKKKALKIETFEDKLNYSLEKIRKVETCFDVECNYPDNDPLEYSLSVYKDISLRIKKYKSFWAKSWNKIPEHQKKYIVGMLSHHDGFVKKETLSLLSKLPSSESAKYLDLVLDEVIGYHDSKLIPTALNLIKNTTTKGNELKVSQSLSTALKQGGPHVSQEISKNIGTFISPATAGVYSKLLPQMPESAPETIYLSSALTEYEMKQSGG